MSKGVGDANGFDPVCNDDSLPRYPQGEYDVCCFNARTYRDPRFKRWVCRLDCHFLTEKGEVCAFLNLGAGEAPTAGRGSEYWRVWVMASGERPKRGRLSKSVFKGKVFRVRIADTVARFDRREHAEAARYSTIKEFLSRVGP